MQCLGNLTVINANFLSAKLNQMYDKTLVIRINLTYLQHSAVIVLFYDTANQQEIRKKIQQRQVKVLSSSTSFL